MKRRTRFYLSWALCFVAALMLYQPLAEAWGQGNKQYITGTVVGIGGRFGGRTLPFTLIVNRYTTPEEVQRLNAALQSGGQDEVLKVLSGMNAGRIQIGNNVGVTANAIIADREETGTKITVLYQRNINIYELRYGTRSQDYKFGYAELYLGGQSGNKGTFFPAAKVRLRDNNTWEVEDFGVYPARLMGLRMRGGAKAY